MLCHLGMVTFNSSADISGNQTIYYYFFMIVSPLLMASLGAVSTPRTLLVTPL